MSKFTATFNGAKREDLYLYDQALLGLALSMRFPSDRGSGMIGYLVSDEQYANEPWQHHGPAIEAEAEVPATPDTPYIAAVPGRIEGPIVFSAPTDPGEAPASLPLATYTARYNSWKHNRDIYDKFTHEAGELRILFVNSLSASVHARIGGPAGILRKTTRELYTALHAQYGTLLAADIVRLKEQLATPYQQGNSLEEFCQVHRRIHFQLQLVGNAVNPGDQIIYLKTGIQRTRFLWEQYVFWVRLNPNPITQSFESLAISLQEAVDNGDFAVDSTPTTATYTGQPTTAAALGAPKPKSNRGKTLHCLSNNYCYTCGWNTSHTSSHCPRPAADHDKTEGVQNPKGHFRSRSRQDSKRQDT